MALAVFFSIFIALAIADNRFPPPRSLEVNHKTTHEGSHVSERRHLPVVEVFKSDSTTKLPIFGWKLHDRTNMYMNMFNISQTHFEIELYHEYYSGHTAERALVWKSDKIASNEHFCNLNHLQSDLKNIFHQHKWDILSFRVRSTLKNKQNENLFTEWSPFGRFIVTSSMKSDWNNASFIAQATKSAFNSASPRFTKTFSIDSSKQISSAMISIVGLGFYRFYINDLDILNAQKPSIYQIGGWTNTKYRVPYSAFDVGSDLVAGNNTISVLLGEGYRNQTAYTPRDGKRSADDPIDCILKLQIIIKYADNSQQIIKTDDLWQTATSKILLSSIYNGEVYDDTAEINQQQIVIGTGPPGILYPSVQPYVSINKVIEPVDIYTLSSHNSQIVDFGQNNGGVVRINIEDLSHGDIISMKFAEIKQHPPYGPMDGSLYYDNLRSAQQFDTYKSDGSDKGFYTPYFTMHGFRYMEVFGYPRKLTVSDVQKLQIYADVTMRANWSCSDEILNKVNERCINGQLSNLKSVPTDCNQRDERLGWMGDAALSSNSFAINFDMKSFMLNYLTLMADEQMSDGSLPDVVPFYRYGNRPSDPNWGIAFAQNIAVLYEYYGNSMMDMVQSYMSNALPNYLFDLDSRMPKTNNDKDDISKYPASYGDWCPPPPSPKISNNFAGAFGYIETVRIVKKLANIIGNTSYEMQLNELQNVLCSEFVNAFYANDQYLNGLQSSYAMSLHSEIYTNESMKNELEKKLLQQIDADKKLLTTGIIGTKFIFPILHQMNQTSLTLDLIKGNQGVNGQMNASYPSFAFEQESYLEPATAIWEIWNADSQGPGMNSRNHHMFSSVSAYLSTDVSGIKNVHSNHWILSIGHLRSDELRWSKFATDGGLAQFDWEWLNANELLLNVVIPIGHFGHLHFKLKDAVMMDMNNEDKIWQIRNYHIVSKDRAAFIEQYDALMHDRGMMMIGSGHYQWRVLSV